MPQLPKPNDVTKLAKDALYITVGLGVLGFQKVQVQRQELRKQLRGQAAGARSRLDERVQLVEERLTGVEDRINTALDQLEERLPGQARELSRQARAVAKDARGQVRGLVRSNGSIENAAN